MNEQELRSEFFAKTGRVATSEPVEYQAFLWGFTAAAASRDAEVAELQKAIDDNWVTHQQIVAANKECDQLRKDVTMLRDAVKFWMRAEGNYDLMKADKKFQEALAATEPS